LHPILISLGPFKLRVYGLALALSFLLGSWLALKRGRERGMNEDKLIGLFWWIVISSIVGARILFVQAHPGDFRSPAEWFAIWTGGLTLYGGLIAAVLASWFYIRRQRMSFLAVADVIAPSLALGEGITRIGCFFNGCCFGRACANGLAVHFPPTSYAASTLGPGVAVWPSQLMLSAALFLTLGILLVSERRLRARGGIFGLFLLLQGIARYLVDFTRYYEPSDRYTSFGPWLQTHSQLIALVLVLAGIGLLAHAALRAGGAAREAIQAETPGKAKAGRPA
jgi:phosphatidylglycerol:prolipoprotein diacylglycerol transferase